MYDWKKKQYIYMSQISLNSFIKFFLKLFNEVASLIDFWKLVPRLGSSKTERSLPCGEVTFDQVQVVAAPCGSAMDL